MKNNHFSSFLDNKESQDNEYSKSSSHKKAVKKIIDIKEF